LYEYYERDGKRHVIILGYGIVETTINTNGVFGQIPFIVCPLFFDEDTPYGMSLYEVLQPSLNIVSTAINQIADNTSISIKSPMFTFKDVLPSGFSLADSSFYDVVPLDIDSMRIDGNLSTLDVRKFIGRLEFKEVTEGAMFLLNSALDNIWYVTGLNAMSLGGIQDKQVRVSGAADMMQQNSVRSSNIIVKNIETYFMNPLTRQLAHMFVMYYEDFGEFQQYEIPKETAENVQNNVRVVNGSYLPADQYNEMQRTDALLNLAMQSATMDQVEIRVDWLKARGVVYPERYFKDPLSTLEESQMVAVVSLMRDKSPEVVQQMFEQQVQAREASK
jgi:hypothetical protein